MNSFKWIVLGLGFGLATGWCQDRPNILWITSEDNGPHIGAYGDSYATTPNIDGLARRGVRYLNAWSNAPVCAPARTTIISGIYPPATGSEHMRSLTRLPDDMKMFPEYLRAQGYYCTNNNKEDYNLEKSDSVWDVSSRTAHWKNRGPGQPFFAVFNHTISHESQLRVRPHTAIHDPAGVRVPAYHPDTPTVRQDWAQYYDKVTEMDALVGKNLRELEEAGLADDTIVLYFGDHGSGMPRNKRWPYNSGLHVPFIVHVPKKWDHLAPKDYQVNGTSDRLLGFIDLAPTMLSLAGIQPHRFYQGKAFMGAYQTAAPKFMYGFRGRMDERYDLVRVVRNDRYIYIRNYMPHKIYGQYLDYMFQTPTTREWKSLYDQGKLHPPQTYFWEEKPSEELYDLQEDRDEINNLLGSSEHRAILSQLRSEQEAWALKIRDVGFLPESEIHSRSEGSSPYDMGHDPFRYPLEAVLSMANLASTRNPSIRPQLSQGLQHEDSAVRYWAILGLIMQGRESVAENRCSLTLALEDTSRDVAIMAAEALGRYGNEADRQAVVPRLIKWSDLAHQNFYQSMLALNALGAITALHPLPSDWFKDLPDRQEGLPSRLQGYVPRLLEDLTRN